MTRLGDALLWVACHPVRVAHGLATWMLTSLAVLRYSEGRELQREEP